MQQHHAAAAAAAVAHLKNTARALAEAGALWHYPSETSVKMVGRGSSTQTHTHTHARAHTASIVSIRDWRRLWACGPKVPDNAVAVSLYESERERGGGDERD